MAHHIPLIVELHAEDAAILWLQRDRAVDAPHFNRLYLWRLDERLEANLDGLLVAGRAGWEIALAAFEAAPEPGEAFVLAALAFGAGSARGIGEVLEIVAADDGGALTRAAISALGWLAPEKLSGRVQPLLGDRRAQVRALGIGACSVHRVDPGEQLAQFLEDEVSVRRMAAKLAGELGRTDLLPRVRGLDVEDDPECRFRSAWSSVLLGDRGEGLDRLRSVASRPVPRQRHALEATVLAMEPDGVRGWLSGLGKEAEPLAVRAAGLMGRPDVIPWLIDRMAVTGLARQAGESFSMITGADLEFLDLALDAPADEGPNDDPADENVDLDPEADLPIPDPAAVAAWWSAEESGYAADAVFFVGEPAATASYEAGYDRGYQRQRRAAALALAIGKPERPLPNWRMRERERVTWKAQAAP